MSERQAEEFLQDILEAIRRVETYTAGMSYDQFLKDLKTQDAVIRNVEIIGEAVKNIPETVKSSSPSIPWKDIAGTRDRLIHAYFGTNVDIVWSIVAEDLPQLQPKIEMLLDSIPT